MTIISVVRWFADWNYAVGSAFDTFASWLEDGDWMDEELSDAS